MLSLPWATHRKVMAIPIWNYLPSSVVSSSSLVLFQRSVRDHFAVDKYLHGITCDRSSKLCKPLYLCLSYIFVFIFSLLFIIFPLSFLSIFIFILNFPSLFSVVSAVVVAVSFTFEENPRLAFSY